MELYTIMFIAWLKLVTAEIDNDNTYNYLFTTTKHTAPIGNYYIAHSQNDIINMKLNAEIRVFVKATCTDAYQKNNNELKKRIVICNTTEFKIMDKQYD